MKRKFSRRGAGSALLYAALCSVLCLLLSGAGIGSLLSSDSAAALRLVSLGTALSLTAEVSAPDKAEPAEPPSLSPEPAPVTMPEAAPEPIEATSESAAPAQSEIPSPLPEALPAIKEISADDIEIYDPASLKPDISALLERDISLTGGRILIIHTHSSESYTPEEDGLYRESDYYRTQERAYSVVRVGDELAAAFGELGLEVIHDRSIYDYPSYTGSYSRTLEAVSAYLEKYPDIGTVIDLHRDALSLPDGRPYATGSDGCAQVMFVIGTGESGLAHPNWDANLCLAVHIQREMLEHYDSLCRPISLSSSRYNQHLSPGYFILEVGSTGNTLSEALEAVRRFAVCAAEVIRPAL